MAQECKLLGGKTIIDSELASRFRHRQTAGLDRDPNIHRHPTFHCFKYKVSAIEIPDIDYQAKDKVLVSNRSSPSVSSVNTTLAGMWGSLSKNGCVFSDNANNLDLGDTVQCEGSYRLGEDSEKEEKTEKMQGVEL